MIYASEVELRLIEKIYAKGLSLETLGGLLMQNIRSKEEMMLHLGHAFKLWCRARALDCPPFFWSMDLIGRDTMKKYPTLHSNVKASQAKIVLFYVSDLAGEIAQRCPCDSTVTEFPFFTFLPIPSLCFCLLRSRMLSSSKLCIWSLQLFALH